MSMLPEEDDAPDVQMAPLIDCVFLLLIFFLVATTLKKHEPELPVDLPYSAVSIMAAKDSSSLVLGLDADGRRYVNGEIVSTESLHRILRERSKLGSSQKVRIDADRNVVYQDLIEIVDLCQFYGLRRISFHTMVEKDMRLSSRK